LHQLGIHFAQLAKEKQLANILIEKWGLRVTSCLLGSAALQNLGDTLLLVKDLVLHLVLQICDRVTLRQHICELILHVLIEVLPEVAAHLLLPLVLVDDLPGTPVEHVVG
jgi:hypothetical protein